MIDSYNLNTSVCLVNLHEFVKVMMPSVGAARKFSLFCINVYILSNLTCMYVIIWSSSGETLTLLHVYNMGTDHTV